MTPTIYHAVEMHDWPAGADSQRRKRAQESWQLLYATQGVVPVHYREYKRTAKDIGDSRDLPYFLDVLTPALDTAKDGNEIICFTNDDIILHPQFTATLRRHVAIWNVCTSHRCESHKRFDLNATPDDWVAQSQIHMGRDVFAAKASWLREYWGHLGDFILGAPIFDLHLAAIVRRSKHFVTTRQNLETVIPCCELPRGMVGHEAHHSVWSTLPAHTPAHAHNSRLFREWASKWLPQLAFDFEGRI